MSTPTLEEQFALLQNVIRRVEALEAAAPGNPLPPPDQGGITYTNGMSEPDEHGAVVLEFVEKELRPLLQPQIDELNRAAGAKPEESRYFRLPERWFVREAIETFPNLSKYQRDTIALNTGEVATEGTYLSRGYAIAAKDDGSWGKALQGSYGMTVARTLAVVKHDLATKWARAVKEQYTNVGGEPDFSRPRRG